MRRTDITDFPRACDEKWKSKTSLMRCGASIEALARKVHQTLRGFVIILVSKFISQYVTGILKVDVPENVRRPFRDDC